MLQRHQVVVRLVGRFRGHNEMDFVEVEEFPGPVSDVEVPTMNGVEGSAENTYSRRSQSGLPRRLLQPTSTLFPIQWN
jgi:hypothetical protein